MMDDLVLFICFISFICIHDFFDWIECWLDGRWNIPAIYLPTTYYLLFTYPCMDGWMYYGLMRYAMLC